MDFEESLTNELESISALSKRVYPLTAPETVANEGVPYIVYVSSEGVPTKTLSNGYGQGKRVRGEINVIASRYKDMKAITKEVVALLFSFEQRQIGINGPLIQELTMYDPIEIHESRAGLYRCLIEYETYF